MRIISGKYKGKKLEGFTIEGTRPTKDRVKESIFGMIQNHMNDSAVLDLFSGSGSLGLEALSNGAKEVYLVDNNDVAIRTIKINSQNMPNIHIVKDDYLDYLKNTNIVYGLIFLDPPYDMHLINNALQVIKDRKLISQNGLIVCEYDQEIIEQIFSIFKQKEYGQTKVVIFKG